jgi:oxalate decarboxylase
LRAEITGVNMRLTRGSFRELHWHTSDEWAIMLERNARITVLNPDGTIFIDDVGYVTRVAGHYIENTGNTDLVFLETFETDQYVDISMNNWIRRLPPELVTSHLNIDEATIKKIPVENQAVIAG